MSYILKNSWQFTFNDVIVFLLPYTAIFLKTAVHIYRFQFFAVSLFQSGF